MLDQLSPEIHAQATQAAAPILLAGALDNPKPNATTAQEALKQLKIPTDGKVLVAVAYAGCGTHDFAALQKAAAQNGAKLFVVYAQPNDPTLVKAEQQNKLNQMVEGINATVIFRNSQGNVLKPSEIPKFISDLGLTISAGPSPTSVGSALYEDGAFKGMIPNKQLSIVKTASLPVTRSGFSLA